LNQLSGFNCIEFTWVKPVVINKTSQLFKKLIADQISGFQSFFGVGSITTEGVFMRTAIRLALLTAMLMVMAAFQAEAGEMRDKFNQKLYKTQKGDCPWTISEREYGSGKHWPVIMEANHISNPKKLHVGKELIIPEMVSGPSMSKRHVKLAHVNMTDAVQALAGEPASENASVKREAVSSGQEEIKTANPENSESVQPNEPGEIGTIPGGNEMTAEKEKDIARNDGSSASEEVVVLVTPTEKSGENISWLEKGGQFIMSLNSAALLVINLLTFSVVFCLWTNKRRECQKLQNILRWERLEIRVQNVLISFYTRIVGDGNGKFGYETLHSEGMSGFLANDIKGAQDSFERTIKFFFNNLQSDDPEVQERVKKIRTEFDHFQKTNQLILPCGQAPSCAQELMSKIKNLYSRLVGRSFPVMKSQNSFPQ
jgi:hypothetical protein